MLPAAVGCADLLHLDRYGQGTGAGGSGGSGASTGATGGSGGATGGAGGTTTGGECSNGMTEACKYDGPAGSENVGTCKAGSRVCMGGQWGMCTGEVTPATENCDTPASERCIGDPGAGSCTGNCPAAWPRIIPGTPANCVIQPTTAVDHDGNLIVFFDTGAGDADLGKDVMGNDVLLKTAGGEDVIVAKYNPSGGLLWGRRFGGLGDDFANGLAVDGDGGILIAGSVTATVDFGMTAVDPYHGGVDGFVARLEPTGAMAWVRFLGSGGNQDTRALALGPNGDVFVTGRYNLAFFLGDTPLQSADPNTTNLYVARLSGSAAGKGATVWDTSLKTADSGQAATSLAADDSGRLLLATSFTGTIELFPDPVPAGSADIAVALFAVANGQKQPAVVWKGRYAGVTIGGSTLIARAVPGNQGFVLHAIVGDAEIQKQANGQPAVWKLAPDPNDANALALAWARGGVGTGSLSSGLAVDSAGNVTIAGVFQDMIDFSTGQLNPPKPAKAPAGFPYARYVAKLTSAGNVAWQRGYSNGGCGEIAVAAGPLGNIGFATTVDGQTDFGNGVVGDAAAKTVMVGVMDP